MVKWLKKLFGSKTDAFLEADDIHLVRDAFIEQHTELQQPWAMFEIVGFKDDGQIKVEFNWNSAFIKHLDNLGFTAETEQDTVQLFFYASQMKPTGLAEDESGDHSVQLADLPNLSENVNRVVR